MQQPVLPAPPVERGFSHAATLLSLCQRNLPGFPFLHDRFKVVRNGQNRPAEMNTPRPRRSDTLRLALFIFSRLD